MAKKKWREARERLLRKYRFGMARGGEEAPPVSAVWVVGPLGHPDSEVVVGRRFTVQVQTYPYIDYDAGIRVLTGTAFEILPPRTLWYRNVKDGPVLHDEFVNMFRCGIELPYPPVVQIRQGLGTFDLTEYTLEGFSIGIFFDDTQVAEFSMSSDHVWCQVGGTLGPEDGERIYCEKVGTWDHSKDFVALPAPMACERAIVMRRSLTAGSQVTGRFVDIGPMFGWLKYNLPYNPYWASDGWPPNAQVLHCRYRPTPRSEHFGSEGIDITRSLRNTLGLAGGSWTIYWRFGG